MQGVDWIMLGANAIGMAIVVAATFHANRPNHSLAKTATSTTVEVASLD